MNAFPTKLNSTLFLQRWTFAYARWFAPQVNLNKQNSCRAASSFWSSHVNGNGLHKAIADAEKLVGYPTSYNSLKYIIDEEPGNILSLAKKLVGSGHPLLSTARDLFSQDPHVGHHLGGLWILLLSKAAGARNDMVLEGELVNGIHPKQRALAETTDLINTAFLIHQSMVEIQSIPSKESNESTLNFGNKLSVLGGDFLLAKASMELGKLENTVVVELISKSIGHLSEGSILAALSIPKNQPITVKDWEEQVFLSKGSLLANSCESAVTLMGHGEMIRTKAFEFGKNLALAQQCTRDIEEFNVKKRLLPRATNFLLLYALETSNEIRDNYDNYANHDVSLNISTELRKEVTSHLPNIEASVKNICEENYLRKCEDSLDVFPMKTSVEAIKKILSTVCE